MIDARAFYALVQAIIAVESGGNPQVVSPAGAIGLMQVMPANGKALGIADLFCIDNNVAAGCALLHEELCRFGNLSLALAAYNAGSPAVRKAMTLAKSDKWEHVQNFLPEETRDYVPRVLRHFKAAP